MLTRPYRRVQGYSSTCRRTLKWESCEDPDGPGDRPNAGCAKSTEGNLRVSGDTAILMADIHLIVFS